MTEASTYIKPNDQTRYNNTVSNFSDILASEFGDRVKKGVLETKLYDVYSFQNYNNSSLKTESQTIEVHNTDTFKLTNEMLTKGFQKPLVLNMASEKRAGGGWKYGSLAQEEALYYASTYGMSGEMNTEWIPNTDRGWNYPLDIYDAVPGLRCPEHLPNGDYKPEDYEVMEKKIKGIFEIAVENKNDVVVLGALGCGVFKNNPNTVARLFKKVIHDGKYDNKMKIVFAVLCFKDTTNYDIFHKTFN